MVGGDSVYYFGELLTICLSSRVCILLKSQCDPSLQWLQMVLCRPLGGVMRLPAQGHPTLSFVNGVYLGDGPVLHAWVRDTAADEDASSRQGTASPTEVPAGIVTPLRLSSQLSLMDSLLQRVSLAGKGLPTAPEAGSPG